MGTEPRRWTEGIPIPLQRSVMFIVGLGLVIYEASLSVPPRWPLLVVYTGMMGLPLALRADDIRRAVNRPGDEP